MSTRSEIRIFKGKKQVGCVYHHSDGYPEHITEDIERIRNPKSAVQILSRLSKKHGTGGTDCYDKKKYQGDIEYSYELRFKTKKENPRELIIRKHGNNPQKNKKRIFSGTPSAAKEKYAYKD